MGNSAFQISDWLHESWSARPGSRASFAGLRSQAELGREPATLSLGREEEADDDMIVGYWRVVERD
jgi:hypothetical protein